MSTVAQQGSWLKLTGYAALAVLNVSLLVMELLRDDPRWWKIGISVVLLLVGAGGAAGQGRALKRQRTATG